MPLTMDASLRRHHCLFRSTSVGRTLPQIRLPVVHVKLRTPSPGTVSAATNWNSSASSLSSSRRIVFLAPGYSAFLFASFYCLTVTASMARYFQILFATTYICRSGPSVIPFRSLRPLKFPRRGFSASWPTTTCCRRRILALKTNSGLRVDVRWKRGPSLVMVITYQSTGAFRWLIDWFIIVVLLLKITGTFARVLVLLMVRWAVCFNFEDMSFFRYNTENWVFFAFFDHWIYPALNIIWESGYLIHWKCMAMNMFIPMLLCIPE
jgi:hypothetical protein